MGAGAGFPGRTRRGMPGGWSHSEFDARPLCVVVTLVGLPSPQVFSPEGRLYQIGVCVTLPMQRRHVCAARWRWWRVEGRASLVFSKGCTRALGGLSWLCGRGADAHRGSAATRTHARGDAIRS